MLEKLKELFGDAFTDEISGKVSALISTDYVSKADHDTELAAFADAKEQLETANTTIAGYKDMDIETIKQSAEDWKIKAETAEKEAAAKISEMQFSAKLTKAITEAKGKNDKAITALLDLDKLKASKNQDADLAEQLTQAKKDADYLFGPTNPAPPYAAGTGSAPIYTSDAMSAIKAAAGIPQEKGE